MALSDLSNFKSAHRLAQIVIGLLIVGASFDFVNSAIEATVMFFFPSFGVAEDLSPLETVIALTALGVAAFRQLVFIATAVAFLMWLYRAYKNLSAIGVRDLQHSPGWAVGYWFIPILNLFRPLQVVNEVYNGSNPDHLAEGDFNFSNTTTPTLHSLWWGFWLVSRIASNLSWRLTMNPERYGGEEYVSIVAITANALTIAAGILAVFVVRNIERRQKQFIEKASWSAPPPPPIFR